MKTIKLIATLCFLFGSGNFNAKAQSIDTVTFSGYWHAGKEHWFTVYATTGEPFTVDWGDGTITHQIGHQDANLISSWPMHQYLVCDTYTVSIIGSPTCRFYIIVFPYNAFKSSPYRSLAVHIDMKSTPLGKIGSSDDILTRLSGSPLVTTEAHQVEKNRLSLSQLDSINALPQIFRIYAQPQYLEKKIIAVGDTIDCSSQAIFSNQYRTDTTDFEMLKQDPNWIKPSFLYPFELWYLLDYTLPTPPNEYAEIAKGVFVFNNPGEYSIKMINPNVLVHSMYSPSEPAQVFQPISVLPRSSLNGDTIPIIYAQICKGGVYNQHGFNESREGIFTHTVPASRGCDSVITLHLSYYPSADTAHIQAEICAGGRYNLNGFNVSQAGTHYRTAQSQNGCDSVIALHLSYYAAIDTTKIKAAICKNAVYNLNGFHVNQAGIYHRTAQSLNGCDSVIQLNLTVSDVIRDTISTAICEGETYHLNGFNENLAGVYQRMVQTANGCDSLVVLQLSVNPVSRTPLKQSICEGGIYVFGGQNLSTAGTYTQTLVNQYGCDSIVDLTLAVNSASTTPLSAWITCKDSIYSFAGKDLNLAGVYYDTLHTAYGCDSILVLTLGMDSVLSDFEITTSGFLCEDKQVELTAMAENVDYLWNTGETARTIRIWTEGVYSVEVAMGQCQKFKEIEVSCPCKMYLPNIFSPNGDGFNDVYLPKVDFELVQFSMFIYDKWGNVAYKTNTYSGWNGKINGKDASAGVYYCVIEYYNTKYPDKKCIANSSVTLVR